MTRQESNDKIRASNTLPNDKSALPKCTCKAIGAFTENFLNRGEHFTNCPLYEETTDNSASLEKSEPPKKLPFGRAPDPSLAKKFRTEPPCTHDRLTEEGYCRRCGTDMRSGKDSSPAPSSSPLETPSQYLCAHSIGGGNLCGKPESDWRHQPHDTKHFEYHKFVPAESSPKPAESPIDPEPSLDWQWWFSLSPEERKQRVAKMRREDER